MASSSGLASIGTWYHSHNQRTGEVTNTATKFQVAGPSGEEQSSELSGSAAAQWERKLCKATDAVPGLRGGQDSESCKYLLQQEHPPKNNNR
jgi:hypothetical protein